MSGGAQPRHEVVLPVRGVVDLPQGRKVVYDSYGHSGPVIVLLHGIPGWRGTFARVGAQLGTDYRALVPDLPGFGGSDELHAGAHAPEHADAIAGMLDALGVDRFHLVGFDFGGPTAVHLAGRLHGQVGSLTLLATNLFPDTPVPLPLRVATVPWLGAALFRLGFGRPGLMMMWWAAVADRRAFPLRRYRRALSARGARSTRRIFLASLRELAEHYTPVARTARNLELPSQVLWGGRDPFFPVAIGKRTAEALRGRFTVLDDCGHFVPEERPGLVAQEIRLLVERSRR